MTFPIQSKEWQDFAKAMQVDFPAEPDGACTPIDMGRAEETQHYMDGVGILAGAERMDEGLQHTGICEICGGVVNLDSIIAVTQIDPGHPDISIQMSEAEARALLGVLGLPQPAIMCDQHERIEVSTSRDY